MKVNLVDLKKGDKIFRYRNGKIEKFELLFPWKGSFQGSICVKDEKGSIRYIRHDVGQIFQNFDECVKLTLVKIRKKIEDLNEQRYYLYNAKESDLD